jgi:hypothetical protein
MSGQSSLLNPGAELRRSFSTLRMEALILCIERQRAPRHGEELVPHSHQSAESQSGKR